MAYPGNQPTMIRRKLLQKLLIISIIIKSCTGNPNLSIAECECGKSVVFWCNSSSVIEGDTYEWRKGSSHILVYSSAETGTIKENKYLGSSTNGGVVLVILESNIFDNGIYYCNHNFMDSNEVTLSLTCITSTPGVTSNSSSTPRSSDSSATTKAESSSVCTRSSLILTMASVLGSLCLSINLRSR